MSEEKAQTASPLAEAEALSLDTLFDRVNNKLIAGMPEAVTDDEINPVTLVLRKQRLEFLSEQDKQMKAPTAPRRRKPTSVAEELAGKEVDI